MIYKVIKKFKEKLTAIVDVEVDGGFKHWVSLIVALLIAAMQAIMKGIITALSKFEKPQSFTEQQMRIAEYLWKVKKSP
jgi:hypothetical protein